MRRVRVSILALICVVPALSCGGPEADYFCRDPYESAPEAIDVLAPMAVFRPRDRGVAPCETAGALWWVPAQDKDYTIFHRVGDERTAVDLEVVYRGQDFEVYRIPPTAPLGSSFSAERSCGALCTQYVHGFDVENAGPPPPFEASLEHVSTESVPEPEGSVGCGYFRGPAQEVTFSVPGGNRSTAVQLVRGKEFPNLQGVPLSQDLPLVSLTLLSDTTSALIRTRQGVSSMCVRLFDTCSGEVGAPVCQYWPAQ